MKTYARLRVTVLLRGGLCRGMGGGGPGRLWRQAGQAAVHRGGPRGPARGGRGGGRPGQRHGAPAPPAVLHHGSGHIRRAPHAEDHQTTLHYTKPTNYATLGIIIGLVESSNPLRR